MSFSPDSSQTEDTDAALRRHTPPPGSPPAEIETDHRSSATSLIASINLPEGARAICARRWNSIVAGPRAIVSKCAMISASSCEDRSRSATNRTAKRPTADWTTWNCVIHSRVLIGLIRGHGTKRLPAPAAEKVPSALTFLSKFPTQRNRELFLSNRDLFLRIREFTGQIREISNSPHTSNWWSAGFLVRHYPTRRSDIPPRGVRTASSTATNSRAGTSPSRCP